jgi:hypothetical protein
MNLAGISVRRVEDITEALWGTPSFSGSHKTRQFVDVARRIGGVLRPATMPEIAIPISRRGAATGPVYPTNATATNRRGTTWLPCSL